MSKKDLSNFRKPYFGVILVLVMMIAFVGIVSIMNKEQTAPVNDQQKDAIPTAEIENEGTETAYTEIQYISGQGYQLRYPENLKLSSLSGYDRFTDLDEANVEMILVPQEIEMEMDLNDEYLKEAAANYRISGEYDVVSLSDVKKLTSDDKDVSIHMIEVVHDGDMDRFYIVKGQEQTLLITVSLKEEAVEEWKAKITKMVQSITFDENEK